MRNVVDYAKAIKDIVYIITQEEVLLDTEVKVDDICGEFALEIESVTSMKDITIYVPDEYNELDEHDIFILDYINELYGLELEGVYDNCLFAILHEIGHIIDYSKRNKWGKIGKAVIKRYSKKDNRMKNKLEHEYYSDMCAIEFALDNLYTKRREIRRERGVLDMEYNIITKEINKLYKAKIELEREMSYNYRQVTTEYEADKWAAMMLKNYGAEIRNYLTALEMI